jgi:hypothetical protein
MNPCILMLAMAADPQATLSDPAEIVQRLSWADRANRELARQYTYLEESREREFDSKNRIKKQRSESKEVLFLYGRRYERLTAKDGRPLAGKDLAKEEEKLRKETEKRAREPERDRARLAAEEEKRRSELRKAIDEIVKAYDLTLQGVETIKGRRVYRIAAEPRPSYDRKLPPYSFLKRLRGTMWIEAAEFQLVKVDAEVIETFSFGLFLARMSQGSRLHFEQTRVNGEVWLPRAASGKIDGRFLTDRFRGESEVQWSGFRKFQSESRIVETAEIP